MGPNWIHGTKNNPILDLVKSTHTQTHDWPETQIAFDSEGTQLPPKLVEEASEMLWSLIGDAFKLSNEKSSELEAEKSLLDYVKENMAGKVEAMGGDLAEIDRKSREQLIINLASMWGGFIGATTSHQSLKFLWLEECLEGENLFCAGTYVKVLDVVSKPAREGATINYNHVVDRISSNSNHEGYQITIRVRDGAEHCFDEVIVTCPLGWLKRNKEVFEPQLPPRINQAIDSLGYGNLDKVYITFSKAWWDEPSQSEAIAGLQGVNGAIPNVTATSIPLKQSGSQEQDNKHYSGFTTFLAPRYAQETNPKSWFQDCINLAALPKGTEHPTLLFYISGPTADHIAAILREHSHCSGPSKSNREMKAKIWQFFEPYISRLPNYNAENPECVYVDVLATGWTNDEFAGYGSYSNFPVGSTECDKDIEALRDGEGLVEHGVWLAGEHTAPFVASGTVTGAYWAGEKVAERIVSAYNLELGS
jgi:hypothetical protein